MSSPRYAPAGLLVEHRGSRVAIDGGPGAEPPGRLDAWLVTDDRAELIPELRRLARARGLEPTVAAYRAGDLAIEPCPVAHTSHATFGYLITTSAGRAVWAPEFSEFPRWAAGAELMFAEAAGWDRPIRFAHGAGGHAPVVEVSRQARARGVRRLVFAHIGRPVLAAIDAGRTPDGGELGVEGAVYRFGAAGAGVGARRRPRHPPGAGRMSMW